MSKMLGLSTEWLDAIEDFSLSNVVYVLYAKDNYPNYQCLAWMG